MIGTIRILNLTGFVLVEVGSLQLYIYVLQPFMLSGSINE